MNFWIFVGEISFLVIIGFFFVFTFYNHREREEKAFRLSLLFLLALIAVNILFLVMPDFMRTLLFLTVLSLLTISIVQLNSYTREVYLISEYENKVVQLEKEGEILEISYSKANSLNHLGSYVQNQTFEKAKNVEYIKVLAGTAMAR